MLFSILWNHPMVPLQWGAVIGASLVAAIIDVRTGRIPNVLSAAVLLLGYGVSWISCGWWGLADAWCSSVDLALPFVLLFVYGGGGAGDAKIMGALGAWLGLTNACILLVGVTASGALLGLLYALAQGRLSLVWNNLKWMTWGFSWQLIQGRVAPAEGVIVQQREMLAVPYGMAIFVGSCLAAAGAYVWRC